MGGYRTLPWYGGKRGYGKAEWIASFLPHTPDSCYIEPFAGMAGVLLARQPAKLEILNDLNGRVINWWRAVRDELDEFGYLVEHTPLSRDEFGWARDNIDNPDLTPLRRALAFHTVVCQSMLRDDGHSGGWIAHYNPSVGSLRLSSRQDITALARRLRYVQLESADALTLLDRVKDCDYAIVYADPPYPTANTTPYAVKDIDIDALAGVLTCQQGAVALSGYGDEWDMLGWRRVERPALRRQMNGNGENRMEVLWLNDKASATRPGLFG